MGLKINREAHERDTCVVYVNK